MSLWCGKNTSIFNDILASEKKCREFTIDSHCSGCTVVWNSNYNFSFLSFLPLLFTANFVFQQFSFHHHHLTDGLMMVMNFCCSNSTRQRKRKKIHFNSHLIEAYSEYTLITTTTPFLVSTELYCCCWWEWICEYYMCVCVHVFLYKCKMRKKTNQKLVWLFGEKIGIENWKKFKSVDILQKKKKNSSENGIMMMMIIIIVIIS